jgi:nicotinamidase-related amidase
VVLIDFQNDFCSPELFHDAPVTNTNYARTAHRADTFVRAAATFGARVVYTRQVLDFDTSRHGSSSGNDQTVCAPRAPGARSCSSSHWPAPPW